LDEIVVSTTEIAATTTYVVERWWCGFLLLLSTKGRGSFWQAEERTRRKEGDAPRK